MRYAGAFAGSRSIAASKRRAASVVVHPLQRVEPELVLEERERLLVPRLRQRTLPAGKLLPGRVRVGPLVLLFVQLLEIGQRVLVVAIEPQHFGERLERAIDEAAVLVVETEAEQHVGVFELA